MATCALGYFLVAIASFLFFVVSGGCYNTVIGVADVSKVPDNNISSSSELNAATPSNHGRLNYAAGPSWCASSRDSTPYLQVDLGLVHIICAVATQGNSQADRWVRTYQVQYSMDGGNWAVYKEKGQLWTFQGNYDRSTVATRILYEGVQARFIRVYPKSHYGGPCLRLELYGVTKKDCETSAIGVSDIDKVPDHRFTASSSYDEKYKPYYARLDRPKGWSTTKAGRSNAWLQIDLGSAFILCAIATQGNGYHAYEWVTEYKVQSSMDNVDWHIYKEKGKDKNFSGNRDANSVMKNVLEHVVQAKFVKIIPIAYISFPTLRVELYGVTQACSSPLGLEYNGTKVLRLTGSSGTPKYGRLYNTAGAWCSSTLSNMEYIQVDLGNVAGIRGIATQGGVNRTFWIRTFSIAFSYNNKNWTNFTDNHLLLKKNLTANNQSSLRAVWFSHPIYARHVRIHPRTWEGKPCLRFDLYGCSDVVPDAITDLQTSRVEARSVTLLWSTPYSGHAAISSYNIYYNNKVITSKTSSTGYRLTGLQPYTSYTVNVKAVNKLGEGRWTEALLRFRTAEAVPEAAPREITAKRINQSAYNVTWTPPSRDKTHDSITKYDVKCIKQNLAGRKGSHVQQVTTTGEFAILYDLEICNKYIVSVRAWTAKGPGPYSEELLIQNAAISPHGIKVTIVEKRNVTIEWKEPAKLGSNISGYKVKFEGIKPYNRSFYHVGVQETSSRFPPYHVVTNLMPDTQYQFQVATKAGCSDVEYSDRLEAHTKIDSPLAPEILQYTVYGTIVIVTMIPAVASNGPISSYQIIVLRVRNEGDTLPKEYNKHLPDYRTARKLGLAFYITAEVPSERVITETIFVVGDNMTHRLYFNARLEEGEKYKLFIRSITQVDGVTYPGKYRQIALVTVGKYLTSCKWSTSIETVISGVSGVLGAIILVFTVTTVVLMCKLRNASRTAREKLRSSPTCYSEDLQSMELTLPGPSHHFDSNEITEETNVQESGATQQMSQQNNPQTSNHHNPNYENVVAVSQDYMELKFGSSSSHQPQTYESLEWNGKK